MKNTLIEYTKKLLISDKANTSALMQICGFNNEDMQAIAQQGANAIPNIIDTKIASGKLNEQQFLQTIFSTSQSALALPAEFYVQAVKSQAFQNLNADERFRISTQMLTACGYDFNKDNNGFGLDHQKEKVKNMQSQPAFKELFKAHITAFYGLHVDKQDATQNRAEVYEQNRVKQIKAFNSLPEEQQKLLISIRAKGIVMRDKGNMEQYSLYQNEFFNKYRQFTTQDRMLDQNSAQANVKGTKEWAKREALVQKIKDCKDPDKKAQMKEEFSRIYGEYKGIDEHGVVQFVREDGGLKMDVPGEENEIDEHRNANTELESAIAREKGLTSTNLYTMM